MISRIGFGVRVLAPTRFSPFRTRTNTLKQYCRNEISQEELLRLVGGNQDILDELLVDEPSGPTRTQINPDHVPIKPGFLQPLPPKGSRNAKLHRKTDVLGRAKSTVPKKQYQWTRWDDDLTTEDDFAPIPWNYELPDLRPKEPFIYFPPKRELFCEKRSFHWTRQNFLDGVGEIFPDKDIQVEVTITNDPIAAEEWAQDRLAERQGVYGLETKWWMQERSGLFTSSSIPKQWADLALLQLSAENEVLLLQPLDMPIESLDRGIRQILKYKYIKKVGFDIQKKSTGLKMSEVQIHGCHEILRLLQLQLGCGSIEELPRDIKPQDLASMSQALLGLDLRPEDSSTAHWEAEILDDSIIEIAALEAWCCWALYGVVTRLDHDLVSRWNDQLPNALRSKALIQRQGELQSLIEDHGIHLGHVKAAETTQRKLQNIPNWKVAKTSAVELAHDLAIDLEKEVMQETLNKKQYFKNTLE